MDRLKEGYGPPDWPSQNQVWNRFDGLKLLRTADLEEIDAALDMADDCVKERANRGWYEAGEYGPARWDGELYEAIHRELKRRADNANS